VLSVAEGLVKMLRGLVDGNLCGVVDLFGDT